MKGTIQMKTKTEEQILGLLEEPEFSCPKIDEIQVRRRGVECSLHSISACLDEDQSAMTDPYIYGALFELGILEDDIDELRDINASLRVWGDEWKTLALRLISQYEPDMLKR